MKHKADKTAIRKAVLKAFELYNENVIDKEIFRTVAASALAWEITMSLQKKIFSKQIRNAHKNDQEMEVAFGHVSSAAADV